MDGKIKGVLLIIIVATIVSAILSSNYDDNVKQIYSQQAHNVTLENGDVILTPDPMLSPELQVKVWGLAPIGVWIGAGLAIFFMFFSFGGSGVRRR